MYLSFKRFLLPAILVSSVFATALQAQTPKPVLTVSVAGIDELYGDVDYLAQAAGAEDYGDLFKIMAKPFVEGIDKAKPWGFVLQTDGDDFMPLGFVPVEDLEVVFAAIRGQVGEPRDAGDGVWELTDPSIMYVKEKEGFAYIANEKKFLTDLPKDPVALLDGLQKEYLIAVRAFVDNIPQDKKDWAIEQMKDQAQRSLEDQLAGEDEDSAEYKLAKRISDNQIKRLVELINDTDEFTMGLSVDGMAKKTYLDIVMTAKPDTPSAERMELLADNESQHRGFAVPDAAATMTLTSRVSKDDIEQLQAMMTTIRDRVEQEIDDDSDLPDDEAKEQAKDVVNGLMDVIEETVASGSVDGGAALVLQPKSMTFVGGGTVADTKKLEKSLRKLVDLAKDEPDFPEVNFNAAKHRGVAFHTMNVPIPDDEEEARDLFGKEMDVVVGIGKKSAYVAVGNDATSLLKSVIDASANTMKEPAPPFDMVISLLPIFEFASSVQDNPVLDLITTSLEKSEGNNQITLKATSMKDGVQYRLEIQDGVIKALGQAGMMAGQRL